jgi:hypothetical protein
MSSSSKPAPDGQFEKLTDEWIAAAKQLELLRKKKVGKKKVGKKKVAKAKEKVAEQRAVVAEKRMAMDSCNRFSIFVRGASPEVYGILREAGIANQFATLLNVARGSLSNEGNTLKHMRPYERLGNTSAHTAWTTEYAVDYSRDDDWEEDLMEGEEDNRKDAED